MNAWEEMYAMSEHFCFLGRRSCNGMKNTKAPGERIFAEGSIYQVVIVTTPCKFPREEVQLESVGACRGVGDE